MAIEFNKGNLAGRMSILATVGHPITRAKKGKDGKIIMPDMDLNDLLTVAFALYADRETVIDAAYFDEQGAKQHSPRRWLGAVNRWLDEVGDDGMPALYAQLEADGAKVKTADSAG